MELTDYKTTEVFTRYNITSKIDDDLAAAKMNEFFKTELKLNAESLGKVQVKILPEK
jgi:hypothetical protein